MRACAVVLVGCASPAPPVATVPASPSPTVREIERAKPPFELDTSIKTVWGYDPNRPDYKPYIPEEPVPWSEREHVASPVPKARKAGGRRAPCFANRDVLVASEVLADLAAYVVYMGDPDVKPPPPGRYGTCTVKDGKLRDARGRLVAEIGCGLSAYVPGIIDDLGFEVGASGREIAKEREVGAANVLCVQYDEHITWCWFLRDDGEEHGRYGFATKIDDAIRGDEARKLFDTGTITALMYQGSCH